MTLSDWLLAAAAACGIVVGAALLVERPGRAARVLGVAAILVGATALTLVLVHLAGG